MLNTLHALPACKLRCQARRYGVAPSSIVTGGIISAVLLASLLAGLHTSLLYLALPLAVIILLLFLRQPALGLILTLIGGMVLPFTGPGGLNLTILGILLLTGLWLLDMLLVRGDLQFACAPVTGPALLLLVITALALVMGQIPWYHTQAAPISAQLGGLTVFVTAVASFLLVGHQIKETRWLALLTTVVILYGGLHMVGWIEPHLGRYLSRLYQDGATTSMFWLWVVTLACSQALFNRRLLLIWRLALLGVVAMTFYVAYGLNGDWKSGWMPALLSVGILCLLRSWRFGYLLAALAIIPASQIITGAIASDTYSYATRLEAWHIIGEIVKANPLLGLGPANYYWYTPLFRIRGYAVNFNSHNQYVDLIAQTGFLGLLAYLWWMVAIGWLGWRLRKRVTDGFDKAYVYGALAGWVATIAAGAFGDWVLPFVYNVGLLGVRSSILPWLFLGGLLVLERKYRRQQSQPASAPKSRVVPFAPGIAENPVATKTPKGRMALPYSTGQPTPVPSAKRLSIIIINWNTRKLLADCLASVAAEIAAFPADQVETLVVDNASSDGSAAMLQTRFPWVQLIRNRLNVGFAAANNQAMAVASGRYVLLLNSDTKVLPKALTKLVAFLDAHPRVGAAGARYLNPDGSLQPSCYPTPTLAREMWRMFHLDRFYPFGIYRMQAWSPNRPRSVDIIQGAAFLVRRTVLERVGFFDTAYFMYTEEVDLCERIRQAGWRIFFVPDALIIHHGGQSTRQAAQPMFLQLYYSKILYFRKHHGTLATEVYKLILLGATLLRLALTPLAWLEPPERRRRHFALAGHYRQLALALPSM